jgi:hypothetical protein
LQEEYFLYEISEVRGMNERCNIASKDRLLTCTHETT